MLTRYVRNVFAFILILQALPAAVYGLEVCIARNGLYICVEPKGPCELSHLIATETDKVKMDLFRISILNRSGDRVSIHPEKFWAVTESGRLLAMDAPLYESIQLRSKLKKTGLAAQEKTEGLLFFPSGEGAIKRLIYKGYPYFEITLY
jgi:hypothetical protein